MLKKSIIYIVVSLFVFTALRIDYEGVQKAPIKVINQDSVEIKVFDFEGLEHYLNLKNDSTYIINFWSTWCKPCVKEMPHFEEFAQEHKSEKLKLIFVSLDFPNVYEKKLVKFLKMKGIESTCVVLDDPDANNWIPKVSKKWTGAIPATVIYKNEARHFHEGMMSKAQLQKQVKKIMNK